MKKVLFICRGNVGRSQFAEAILRKMYPDIEVSSAGTKVINPAGESRDGQLLKDCKGAALVIDTIKEIGVDISNEARTQLKPEMLEGKDRIIVMSEPEHIPEYLSSHPNYVYWNVADPKGTDLEFHKKIRDEIQGLIETNKQLFQ